MSSPPEVIRNRGKLAKGKNAEGSSAGSLVRLVALLKAQRLSSCN